MKVHDQPLEVEVVGGRLVISIGIDTLAFAADHHEEFTPYDEELGDWVQRWRVFEKGEFAVEVARQMRDEAEDGSTPLTRFMDKMFLAAVEDGCLGIEECLPKTPSVWKTDVQKMDENKTPSHPPNPPQKPSKRRKHENI